MAVIRITAHPSQMPKIYGVRASKPKKHDTGRDSLSKVGEKIIWRQMQIVPEIVVSSTFFNDFVHSFQVEVREAKRGKMSSHSLGYLMYIDENQTLKHYRFDCWLNVI